MKTAVGFLFVKFNCWFLITVYQVRNGGSRVSVLSRQGDQGNAWSDANVSLNNVQSTDEVRTSSVFPHTFPILSTIENSLGNQTKIALWTAGHTFYLLSHTTFIDSLTLNSHPAEEQSFLTGP